MGKQEREIADVSDWRAGDKITLEYTLRETATGTLAVGNWVARFIDGRVGEVIRNADRSVVTRLIDPLPTEPGTVIAIGSWWFVKLEPYEETGSGAWELLPPRNKHARQSMERANVRGQCVYSDEWVHAEAAQEGEYRIVSQPNGHDETVVA